jgi:hypothetical protein
MRRHAGRSHSISIRHAYRPKRMDSGTLIALIATAVEAVEAGWPWASRMLWPTLASFDSRLGLTHFDLVVQLLLVVIIICGVHCLFPYG